MHKAIIDLQNRGLINQSTDINKLSKLLDEGSGVYCGFDPTADSLHVGSLLPLLTMKVLKSHGVNVIALIGGSTGRIGDPSFKAEERKLLSTDDIEHNLKGIKKVIRSILGNDTTIVNNYDWTKNLSVLDFLRDYGKCFTVNNMISKEAVKSRIERPDQGISFTEFTYPILQGMDFEHLFKTMNCKIQIGGSDQWGNMIAGTDLIHKIHGNEVDVGVITLPLLTKADGTKFGKSESGTVWLSPEKTSPFAFSQFWLNITDDEMRKFIPYFSQNSDKEYIDFVLRTSLLNPLSTKRTFSSELTEIVHGTKTAVNCVIIKRFLYGELDQDGKVIVLNETVLEMIEKSGMKIVEVQKDFNFVDLLLSTGLATSKKMAREFISTGAAKVGTRKINEFYDVQKNEYLNDSFSLKKTPDFVLRRGKNDFVIIKLL